MCYAGRMSTDRPLLPKVVCRAVRVDQGKLRTWRGRCPSLFDDAPAGSWRRYRVADTLKLRLVSRLLDSGLRLNDAVVIIVEIGAVLAQVVADDRHDADPTSPTSLRTAQRLELRKGDEFLLVQRSDDDGGLEWRTCCGLADLGNDLMPPNADDGCAEAVIVVNLSQLWRAVRRHLPAAEEPT